MKSSAATHADEAALRACAMSYPGAYEDHPWGESAFKVKGKVFLFVYVHAEGLNASMKLPTSNERALAQPFSEPTGYGLGKSGWVTCKFERRERVPMDLVKSWIDESYRAVAPKKFVDGLAGDARSSNGTANEAATGATESAQAASTPSKKPVRRGAAGAPESATARGSTSKSASARAKTSRAAPSRAETSRDSASPARKKPVTRKRT